MIKPIKHEFLIDLDKISYAGITINKKTGEMPSYTVVIAYESFKDDRFACHSMQEALDLLKRILEDF